MIVKDKPSSVIVELDDISSSFSAIADEFSSRSKDVDSLVLKIRCVSDKAAYDNAINVIFHHTKDIRHLSIDLGFRDPTGIITTSLRNLKRLQDLEICVDGFLTNKSKPLVILDSVKRLLLYSIQLKPNVDKRFFAGWLFRGLTELHIRNIFAKLVAADMSRI